MTDVQKICLNPAHLTRLTALLVDYSMGRGKLPGAQLQKTRQGSVDILRTDGRALEKNIETSRPHVLLMRVATAEPSQKISASIRHFAHGPTNAKIVVIADRLEIGLAVNAFRSGARGFLQESDLTPEVLAKCLDCVHRGQFWMSNHLLAEVMGRFSKPVEKPVPLNLCGDVLSPREKEVMNLLVEGLSNRQIAGTLQIKENTVKKYVYSVFNKRGVSSRVGLLRQAFQHERESA